MLDFNEYQNITADTAIYPEDISLAYLSLGLVGEAGEIANKVKKIYRDSDGILTTDRAAQIANELGDVLWYVAELATKVGFSLDTVAKMNLNKLAQRKAIGTLGGSGDDR